MKRGALSVVGCPRCFGRLTVESDEAHITEGYVCCAADGIKFPVTHGVPELVRPERTAWLDTFAGSYGQAWERANQARFDSSQLLALPYLAPFSGNRAVWEVKAKSMEALFRFLEARSPKRVLDLGGGVGWLSSHLARRGYETYSVDASIDGGLMAAEAYLRSGVQFERIRGEIEFPPFQDGVFDAVICNASIHYAGSLRSAFLQISRILANDRDFVMMNSPVHEDPRSARRAQDDARSRLVRYGALPAVAAMYHHYSFEEVREAFQSTFGSCQELSWDPGLRFRFLRQAKARLLRMELARFPILWATKKSLLGAG